MAVRFFPHLHDVFCADLSPRSPVGNRRSRGGMICQQRMGQHGNAPDDDVVLADHVAINHAGDLVQPVNPRQRNNSTQCHLCSPLSKRGAVGEILTIIKREGAGA